MGFASRPQLRMKIEARGRREFYFQVKSLINHFGYSVYWLFAVLYGNFVTL